MTTMTTTTTVKTAADAESAETVSEQQSRLWFARTILALLFKIMMPIFDLVTDVYTVHRYYRHAENKPLMMNVFRASFFTILFHNAVSTWRGIDGVNRFHARFPLATWSGAAWKTVTLALHALGIGNVTVAVEAFFVVLRLDSQAAAQR